LLHVKEKTLPKVQNTELQTGIAQNR